MTKLFISLIEWVGERLAALGDWLADILDDDCAVKRTQAFTILLIVMLVISMFKVSLPKDEIIGKTLYRGDVIYGISGDTARLDKGVDLDILGYRQAVSHTAPLFWAQAEDGQRYFVPQVNVVSEFIALKAMDDISVAKFDTVKIEPNFRDPKSYMLTNTEGKRHEISIDDLEEFVSTLVDENLSNHKRGSMSTHMSKWRFERRFLGKEIDYRYADYVRHYGSDSTVVAYGIKIINRKGEDKGIARPIVTYIDGEAQSYTLGRKKSDGDYKLLAYIPLSSVILDYCGWIINDRYDFGIEMRPTTLAKDDGVPPIWFIILGLLCFIFAAVWFSMTNHIFSGLIFSLLPFSTPLDALSNRAVYRLIKWLMWISFYIWFVLMLANGGVWWILLPLMYFTSRRMVKRLYSQLIIAPAMRCEYCKAVDTKYRTNHEFVRRYVDTVYRTVLTAKRTVTGSEISSENTVTRYYTKYKETYDVDVFHDTYVCASCEHSEKVPVENRKLTSRVKVGSEVDISRS